MSEKPANNDRAQFVVSLLLVGVGAFLLLISVLTLKNGGIPESGGGAAVVARATLGTFGMVPGLLAGLAVLAAGCWIFLTEEQQGVWKHLAGALCTAFALSILLGALSLEAGGTFGALSGGAVSGVATKAGGALFGVLCLAAPVWLFWLRDRVDLSRFVNSAPRSAADAELEDTGVSALEAEALAPPTSAGQAAPELTNPYPEDVRLRGAVPEGATPIDMGGSATTTFFDDAPVDAPDTAHDPAVHRWTPDRHADDESADQDLAVSGPVGASWERADDDADVDDAAGEDHGDAAALAVEDHEDELGEPQPLELADDPDDPFAEHRYGADTAQDDTAQDAAAEDAAALGELATDDATSEDAATTAIAYQPPRPSWEEPYEDEVGEAVPLEVAEALETEVEDEAAPIDDEEELVAATTAPELDEVEDVEETDADAEAAEDEVEEVLAEQDDEPEDEEEEYESEDEDDEESADDELHAEADEDEDGEEYEDSEDDSDEEWEYEDEEEADDAEVYAEAEDDEDADDDSEEEWEYEDEEEPEGAEVRAEADAEDDDEEEYDEEEYESEEEPEEDEVRAEADEDEDGEEYEDSEDDSDEEWEYEDEEDADEAEVYAEAEDDESEDEPEEDESVEEEELEEVLASDAEEDEPDSADEDEEVADAAEAEPEPVRAAEEAEEAEQPAAEEATEEPEPVPAAAASLDHGEVQMDLFDEADSGDSEPEVVLEPQAAPGDDARKVSTQMLVDAGNLFLQEGRVAVSMLQKRFALDFDQSCAILDELQDLGLIGPFVDGSRRDILLSSEEWLELTGPS